MWRSFFFAKNKLEDKNMNSISLFNVKISDGFEGRDIVSVTNDVASFHGHEVAITSKDGEKSVKYRNHSFRAYDDMANRISKMKLRVGSEVNIVGELDQYIDSNKRKQNFIKILTIDFVPYSKPQKSTDQEKTNQTEQKSVAVSVDLNDSSLFNCNVDEEDIALFE